MVRMIAVPATVLFPTPPFPLATATTRFTLGILRFSGIPPLEGILGGILSPDRGRPYHNQSFELDRA